MVVCGGGRDLAGLDTVPTDVWSMALGGARRNARGKDSTGDSLPILGPTVWPNPAREAVNVSFTLPEPCRVSVAFYGVTGRLVRTVKEADMRAGVCMLTWNGLDGRDRSVSEGIYFCRIAADGFTYTLPAVVLR